MAEAHQGYHRGEASGLLPGHAEPAGSDGEIEYVDYYGQRRYIEESVIACFERHKAKPKEQWPEPEPYRKGMKIV